MKMHMLRKPKFLKKTKENLVFIFDVIRSMENFMLVALSTFDVDFVIIIHSNILILI